MAHAAETLDAGTWNGSSSSRRPLTPAGICRLKETSEPKLVATANVVRLVVARPGDASTHPWEVVTVVVMSGTDTASVSPVQSQEAAGRFRIELLS
jgi:hypothetical protein